MFDEVVRNKFFISDELYAYDSAKNIIEKIVVFAITYEKNEGCVKYNYKYYEDSLFYDYDDAFKFARKYLSNKFTEYLNKLKGGDSNASS